MPGGGLAPSRADASTLPIHCSACRFCGASPRRLVSDRDRNGRPLETAICPACGLVSHAVIPSESELIEYYATRYRLDYNNEETPSPHRVMKAWCKAERMLRLLGPRLAPGARVHDFGAGIGCAVKVFERAGFDSTGIEPGEGFCRFGAERLGARLRRATIADPAIEPPADLGLLAHVIEHLRDPVASLRVIRDRLAPGGLLYIECPNLAGPFARFGRMFHSAHIYNFTPATLDAVARVSGFEPVAAMSPARNEDLARLYRVAPETPIERAVDPGECDRTLAAIRRLNIVTYHVRPYYLKIRTEKIARSLSGRAFGGVWLSRLERAISSEKSAV